MNEKACDFFYLSATWIFTFLSGCGHIGTGCYCDCIAKFTGATVSADDYKEHEIKLAFYRKLDKLSQMQVVSGRACLKNAGVTVTDDNATDIGMIIGTAFTTIVKSLVDDMVMPFIGWLIGGMDFTAMKISLSEEASINYGTFVQNIISFLAIAFVVFCMVKLVNKIHKKKEE